MLLIYIFLFATQFRLRTKAKQAMEAAGFMSATQLPKVAGGQAGGGRATRSRASRESLPGCGTTTTPISTRLWRGQLSSMSNWWLQQPPHVAATSPCSTSPSPLPVLLPLNSAFILFVYRTHLAALAGMHAVVETGGLIPADATEHGGAIEFCKKQKKRTLKIFQSKEHTVNLQDITNLAH